MSIPELPSADEVDKSNWRGPLTKLANWARFTRDNGSVGGGDSVPRTQMDTFVSGLVGSQNTTLGKAVGVTVLPSGDLTGATDIAAINTALLAGNVILRGTYYTLGAIQMPSNRTLTAWDAEVRRINDKGLSGYNSGYTTNCNIVTNLNMDATGNQNIVVRGIGRASFRLHGATDGYIRSSNTAYSINNYFGFFFVNVSGLTVQDLSIGPTRAFTSNIQVCKDVSFRNVRCNQDRVAANQDGLDIGPGCFNVVFDGITGVTSDDGFSIYAQNTSGSLHAYTTSLTAAQRNVTDIDIRNVQMDVGINVFRFQAGDGSKLKRVTASNITNLRTAAIGVNADTAAVFQFGSTNYVNNNPATTDFSDFALTGYKGKSTWLIGADSNFSNVRMSSINLEDAESLIGYRAMKNKGDGQTYVPQFNNVTIDGVVLVNTNAAEPTLVRLPATQAVDTVIIRNVTADTLKWLTRNGGFIGNLSLANIRVASVTGAVFGSTFAESGTATNIDAALAAGATGVYRGSVIRLQLRNTPFARASDTTPAPVVGSQLTFAAGLDPTGGNSTSAGIYAADGVAWNRIATLANDPASSSQSIPSAPTDLTLSGSPAQTQATFTFTPVSGATSYPYRVRTVGAASWLERTGPTSSPFTATSLTAGQNYEIQIASANTNGQSAYSASVTFTTPAGSSANSYSTNFPTQSSSGIPAFTSLATSNYGIVDANGAGLAGTPSTATWYFTSDSGQSALGNDQHAKVTIGAKATAANLSPVAFVRQTGSPATSSGFNLVLARWNGATSVVELIKIVAGASTSLGTVAQSTLPTDIDIKAVGSTFTVYVNGATSAGITATAADSALASGKCGIGFRYTAAGDLAQRITVFASGDAS